MFTCQNATLLEITCHSSFYFVFAVTLSIKEAALDAFVDTIEPRTEV